MMSRAQGAPTIAAVIANYNYETYVAGAVSSLLAQTVPFDEIIVVDDGSTDGSVRILESFGDSIRLIEQENGGQLSAALAGVAACSSDYVYVLDSDDLADPRLLETVLPLLEAAPVKVQFQLHSMDQLGRPIDSIFPTYRDGYDSSQMVRDNELLGFYVCPPTSGNVLRADYVRRVGEAGLTLREAYDGVPAQAAPYFGAIVSLNTPLAQYRVHESSDSQWGRPTPDLLRSEIRRYSDRWVEVDSLLASHGRAAQTPESSAFVLERRLMIDVLEQRRSSVATVAAYSWRVLRSGLSLSQRVAFAGWASALLVLPRAKAVDLVFSRRSAAKRSRLLTAVARLARSSRALT